MKSSRPTLIDTLLVLVGGSSGTLARYALTSAFQGDGGLPIVLTINVTGAFLLGFLAERIRRSGSRRVAHSASLLLGTGALGGFTTYGTFAGDAEGLLDMSRLGEGVLYGVVTVVIGVAAAYAGTVLAGRRGNAKPDGAGS